MASYNQSLHVNIVIGNDYDELYQFRISRHLEDFDGAQEGYCTVEMRASPEEEWHPIEMVGLGDQDFRNIADAMQQILSITI